MHTNATPSQVLVVDDDEGLSVLVTEALRGAGLKATSVPSGALALESLKKHRADLILLDLKLSDLSGPALLERLNQANLSVPFIIVTGQGDERIAVDMMKHGALDYLVKDAGMLDRLPVVVKRAIEKLESDRELAAARSALLESEKQILAASEGERQRLGADLHDNLGQQLTAIELLCQSLRQTVRRHPDLDKQMGEICRHLREAVTQVRQLARGLMPVSLGAEGLTDGLAEMVRRMSQGAVPCVFVCESPVEIQDVSVANHLFRIAQEAINNAIKHARANKVTVTLSRKDDVVSLVVEDDGEGFPKSKKAASGVGLQFIRHRANVIGATLETKSSPGRGVKVICTLRKSK